VLRKDHVNKYDFGQTKYPFVVVVVDIVYSQYYYYYQSIHSIICFFSFFRLVFICLTNIIYWFIWYYDKKSIDCCFSFWFWFLL